jgi:hypothetical protein
MLENHGFVLVGRITLELPAKFQIEFDDVPEARWWRPAIYAFRISDEVVRIGKAKNLGERICQWNKDVPRALAGKFQNGGTNPWEAFEWRRRLVKHSQGEFLAQVGPTDMKLLGHLERKLIGYYNPCLCNDSVCGRMRPPIARSVKNVATATEYWRSLNHSGDSE